MEERNPVLAVIQVIFGSTAIAYIKLSDAKDITAIAVGLVTIVCLLYSTFLTKKKKE